MGVKWTTRTVREIVEDGILERPLDGNHGELHPKSSDFVPTGIPFIMASDLVGGRVDTQGCSFISETLARSLRKGFAKPGDVLLTHKATMGRTALVGSLDVPFLMLTPQVTYYRVVDRTRLDPYFLKLYFDGHDFQSLIERWGNKGSTRAYLGISAQLDLPIQLPPIEIQRAIAHILGTLDDKIELNRRMNETLEAMARALFKSWFVDFDPVRAKSEGRTPAGMSADTAKLFPSKLVESTLGPIPKGWKVARLSELTNKIGSGATPRGGDKAYILDGTSLIRSQNVYDSAFVWNGLVHIADDEARRLRSVTVDTGDVLLNITGASFLRTCIVDPQVLPARVNQHVAIVRAKEGIPSRYIHNHLLLENTKGYLSGMDAGASRQAITKAHIESVPIIEPLGPILVAWDHIVAPLYGRMNTTARETRNLSILRDSLLPRLLSGELSVANVERVAGAAL